MTGSGDGRLFAAVLAAVIATAPAAFADVPPAVPGAPPLAHPPTAVRLLTPPAVRAGKTVHRKVRARKAPEATLLPPNLQLAVDAPSPDGPWTLRIDNTGAIPVRVLADARLLALDLQPESAPAAPSRHVQHADDGDGDEDEQPDSRARSAHAVRCELPADMRPNEDDDRSLVLPAGRSYVEKFDPRLFCFGARDAAALVAGTKVTPHLVGSRDVAVLEPIEEVEPKIASVHDWPGVSTSIGPSAAPATSKDAIVPDGLTVSTPAFTDNGLGWEAEVVVTVTNRSPAVAQFLFRPETLAFDVTGPSGVGVTDPSPITHCGWPGPPPAPVAEGYTRLAQNQSASITVLLSALCPDDTLRHPGLYVVRARLDTRRTSGASIGIRTFTGTVLAAGATRLRVREWNGPPPPAGRPQLVEQPVPAH